MLRKILTSTFFYSISNQIPALVNLFLLPILTPHLQPSDYAIYGLVLAYSGLVGAFSSLGYIVNFQNAYFHEGAQFKARWSRLLAFQWLYKIVYAGVVTGVLYFFIGQRLNGEMLWEVMALVVVPILFFDLTKSIGTRLCQYRHEHSRVYRISIVTAFVSIASTVVGILYFHLGFLAWFISAALASGIQAVYFGYLLYVKEGIRPQFAFHASEIREDLRVALPLIPKDYASYIMSSSDRVILDRCHVGETAIGQYNIAYAFAGYFENIQLQANQVMTPIFFDLFKRNSEEANGILVQYIRVWFTISLVMATCIGLWIPEAFHFLYRKEELSAGFPMAVVLVFGFCYRPLYVAAVDRAIFEKRTPVVLKITLVSALVNLIVNLALIPVFGVWVAVLSTVLSYVSMGLLGYFFSNSNKLLMQQLKPQWLMALMICCALAVYYLSGFGWMWKLGMSVFIASGIVGWYVLVGKKRLYHLLTWHHQE